MYRTLKFFAFLDVISIVFLGMQLVVLFKGGLTDNSTTALIKTIGWPVIFLLLIAGIPGLFQVKKYGMILYYIQFPLRLLLWVFSIGFITFLPEAFSLYEDYWFDWLFRVCVVAEFFRLYFTVKFHRTLSRR